MKDVFLPYAKQSIDRSDIEAVAEILTRDIITRGEGVEAFESKMASYCGVRHAVAFNSGTTALIAACHAARLTSTDRVLTTPNTFVATVGAALHYQAVPVLIDIDRTTGSMDLSLLCSNMDYRLSRGRLVCMPVHFAGIAMDMRRIYHEVRAEDTLIIEDAAHALGSYYPDGQKVGSCAWSDMTMFSFHPAKQITTGEGGMVTTNDPDLAYRLRLFRNNGIVRDQRDLKNGGKPWYYEVQEITGNYNFTDFQAALGLSQLNRLDKMIDHRRSLVALYRKKLGRHPHIRLLTDSFDGQTSFHLFVVQIDFATCRRTREEVMEALKTQGIGSQVHYIPIYRHPFFKKYTAVDLSEYFPHMEKYYEQALSLPLYANLTEENVERVCESLITLLA